MVEQRRVSLSSGSPHWIEERCYESPSRRRPCRDRGDFRIRLVFNDGVEGTIDFSDWLMGPVTRPNGADIAPGTLHERAKPNAAA